MPEKAKSPFCFWAGRIRGLQSTRYYTKRYLAGIRWENTLNRPGGGGNIGYLGRRRRSEVRRARFNGLKAAIVEAGFAGARMRIFRLL